jgi:ABC-type dipeptide/oligopeptide/nickel transport system permease subunit
MTCSGVLEMLGSLMNESRTMAQVFPELILFPCLAISSLVLGLNLLADSLQGMVHRG